MNKFRNRLMMMFLILSLVPILGVSYLFKATSYSDFLKSATEFVSENSMLKASEINYYIKENETSIQKITAYKELNDLMINVNNIYTGEQEQENFELEKATIDEKLENIKLDWTFADDIYITNLKNVVKYSKNDKELEEKDLNKIISDDYKVHSKDMFTYLFNRETNQFYVKYLVQNVKTYSNLGYVVFLVNDNFFFNPNVYNKLETKPSLLFIDKDNKYSPLKNDFEYISKTEKIEEIKDMYMSFINGRENELTFLKYLNNKDMIFSFSKIEAINAIYYDTIDQYELLKSQSFNDTIFFVIIAVVMTLCLILSVIFSNVLTNPIKDLKKTMQRVRDGNLDVRSQHLKNDEIGYVSKVLNTMLDNIQTNYEELTSSHQELVKNKLELESSENRHRLVVESTSEVIWEWNVTNGEFITSSKWEDVLGIEVPKTVDFEYMESLIHPEFLAKNQDDIKGVISNFVGYYKNKLYQFDIMVSHPVTEYKWISVRAIVVDDENGLPLCFIGSFTDITQSVVSKEKLHNMAYKDNLTGLYNSRKLQEAFDENMKNDHTKMDRKAIIMFDLDHFKMVNDTHGHDAGDVLIKHAGELAKLVFCEDEYVCRQGGDEFVIFCPKVYDVADLKEKADKLRKLIGQDVKIGEDIIVNVTSSIGVAVYPQNGRDFGMLLKNADIAMYKSKEMGRNKVTFFDNAIADEVLLKSDILECLRGSVENNELQVYYLPEIDIETGKIKGFEALLRLFSEKLGSVDTASFLEVADENGLMPEIGIWSLRKVCETIAQYEKERLEFEVISINISVKQLISDNFVEELKNIVEEVGINPNKLQIEITEIQLLGTKSNIYKIVAQIQDMGIRIALDDFASDQSSLAYIRNFNISALKIDKMFVGDIGFDKKDSGVVKMIVELAHSLGLYVVAEGVERKDQYEQLKNMGCDRLQGYVYSKAIPEIEARLMLKRQRAGLLKPFLDGENDVEQT